MNKTYDAKIGLLKTRVASPTTGRKNTLSIGRIQISADALVEVGITVGDKYSVRVGKKDREIEIVKSTNCNSRFLTPATSIRFSEVHTLEFLGNHCRIAAQNLELTDIVFRLEEAVLVASLPDAVRVTHSQKVAAQRYAEREARNAERAQDWREVVRGHKGAAAAIALDAHRYGMKDTPIALGQMISLLRDEGHRISQINERLWRLDDYTATLGDLVQLARKYEDGLVLVAA
ncbi:hypothetical protein ABE562_05010 [Brucella intermedia]|uniref:Uncharacterized protein n=1 Tax=Brucella intermedia GD04153 TaxID=2975438 RepID=A0AA42KMD6_9HYPH|nr:hypothetical protein [Brucella intermedia]MDH0123326.1 hypothetical protein [Brucella intermedia GD04153]